MAKINIGFPKLDLYPSTCKRYDKKILVFRSIVFTFCAFEILGDA